MCFIKDSVSSLNYCQLKTDKQFKLHLIEICEPCNFKKLFTDAQDRLLCFYDYPEQIKYLHMLDSEWSEYTALQHAALSLAFWLCKQKVIWLDPALLMLVLINSFHSSICGKTKL